MLAGGQSHIDLQTRIIDESGAEKAVALNCDLLYREKGRVTGVMETFRDLPDLEKLRKQVLQDYTIEDIIGRSPVVRKRLSFLPDIAEPDSSVLIEGATGAGKEMLAQSIGRLSARRNGPFIADDCAALPDTLLESELFGNEIDGGMPGAFCLKTDCLGRFCPAGHPAGINDNPVPAEVSHGR